MIVTCTICGQRFETNGRASKCPHALLQGNAELSRSAYYDATDRGLIKSAIICLYESDKHNEAANILRQSNNPAMQALAEECARSSGTDAQFKFRQKLERAGA